MGFGLSLRKRGRTTDSTSNLRSPKGGSSSERIRRVVNEKGLRRAGNKALGSSGTESGKSFATTSGMKSARFQGAGKKILQRPKKDHVTEEPSTPSHATVVGEDNDNVDGYSSRKTFKQKRDPQLSRMKRNLTNQQEFQRKFVKMAKQRKLSNEDLMTNDLPKKKKRIIRIDSSDISNKRIDDSVPSPQAEEKNSEKCVAKISKNMLLRSIKPSPPALSFVEDNLLGRRRLVELRRAGYNVDLPVPLDNIPSSTSKERSRIEESVFRNKMEFFAAAKVSSSFPPPVLPEVAFAGISNVGKSSLLNALTRQWGVARTSDKPGHTQTINFFRLASKLCLVDLPGYGFAYAKEEVKEAWEDLVMEYVSTREGLQRVCLLVDTKRGMKSFDHELVDLMERSRTPFQVVLTKTDVVFPIDVARRATQIQQDLETRRSMVQPVMMVSSKSGGGIRSLRTALSKLARFVKV